MKILAIEFSSELRSVAVLDRSIVCGRAAEQGGRNTRAFALIQQALEEAQTQREEIECVAVGLGPGSYAGIRTAIALAQGWQLARGVRLLGVSSVEALAQQAHTTGLRGRVHLLIDAQRNEFYAASYRIEPHSVQIELPLRLISALEADALVQKDPAAGDSDLARRWPQLQVLLPDAAAIGQLAATRTDFVSGDVLQPIYLRETNFVKAPPPRPLSDPANAP